MHRITYNDPPDRARLLLGIFIRLEDNHLLFPDVCERLLQTDTPVLREIAASDFEREVFERVRPSRNL